MVAARSGGVFQSRRATARLVFRAAQESGRSADAGTVLPASAPGPGDKFPGVRKIILSPEIEAKIAAQEAAGHLVFSNLTALRNG